MGAIADALFGKLATSEPADLRTQARARATASLVAMRAAIDNLRAELAPEDVQTSPWLNDALARLIAHVDTGLADLPTLDAPARVVLMGRTQAGKSATFQHLTGTHDSEVGEGGQRTTRKVMRAPYRLNRNIVISDAPGVGANDGADDQKEALEEARRADLILWVFTTDSLPEDTRANLALVASWGVPIVRVMQCMDSLVDPSLADAADDLAERVFLKDANKHPPAVLAHYPGHQERANRTLREARQDPGPWIPIHSQAALLAARRSTERAEQLLTASNIRALETTIESELGRNLEARRLATTTDIARRVLVEVQTHLASFAARLSQDAETERESVDDLRHRIAAELDRLRQRYEQEVRTRLEALDRWADHHYRDSDAELSKNWDLTAEELEQDLQELAERHWRQLQFQLNAVEAEVFAAWSKVAVQRQSGPKPKSKVNVNPVWLDPLVKSGGSVIGMIVGGVLSGGNPIAIVAGGFVGEKILSWASGLLGNRREQLNRRRGDLHERVLEAKAEQLQESLGDWDLQVERVKSDLAENIRAVETRVARHEGYSAHSFGIAEETRLEIARLDTQLVRDLLGLRGCNQLREALSEVHRTPGGTTLVGLDSEIALEESAMRRPVGLGDLRYYPTTSGATRQRKVAHALVLGRSRRTHIEMSGASATIVLDAPRAAFGNEQWVAEILMGTTVAIVHPTDQRTSA